VAPHPYFPTSRDRPWSLRRQLADGILNLIYPEDCFICATPVFRHQDRAVCDGCWTKIGRLRIAPPWCALCGLPFQGPDIPETHVCGRCTLETPAYSGARSFGYYTAELGALVQAFKFDGRRNLVTLIVPMMVQTFFESWARDDFDVIIPVPLHPRRERERGFNQAYLLARSLAGCLSLPIRPRALQRVVHTAPQVGLNDRQRERNMQGAFSCRSSEDVTGRRVLLVDDVMTTGATVASASRALLGGGALRVSALTLARAVVSL
jgi:ComF family protein